TSLELAAPEALLHGPADRLPPGTPDAGMDAAIGHDLDVPVGEEQVDEDAVVALGVPYAGRREHLDGARPCREACPELPHVERVLDDDADLPVVLGLGLADRALDRVERTRREGAPGAPRRRHEVTEDSSDAHVLTSVPRRRRPRSCHRRPR